MLDKDRCLVKHQSWTITRLAAVNLRQYLYEYKYINGADGFWSTPNEAMLASTGYRGPVFFGVLAAVAVRVRF